MRGGGAAGILVVLDACFLIECQKPKYRGLFNKRISGIFLYQKGGGNDEQKGVFK